MLLTPVSALIIQFGELFLDMLFDTVQYFPSAINHKLLMRYRAVELTIDSTSFSFSSQPCDLPVVSGGITPNGTLGDCERKLTPPPPIQ